MGKTIRNEKTNYGWNKNYDSPKFKSSHGSKTESEKLELRNSNRSIKKRQRLVAKEALRELIKSDGGTEV